jgi:hypothetical protein
MSQRIGFVTWKGGIDQDMVKELIVSFFPAARAQGQPQDADLLFLLPDEQALSLYLGDQAFVFSDLLALQLLEALILEDEVPNPSQRWLPKTRAWLFVGYLDTVAGMGGYYLQVAGQVQGQGLNLGDEILGATPASDPALFPKSLLKSLNEATWMKMFSKVSGASWDALMAATRSGTCWHLSS